MRDARAEVKLNGTIPAELGGLTELTRLYLHRNNLAGEIPGELNDLTNLVWLRIYDNMLSGDVPDLSGMTSLERVYIHQNQLTGGVPTGLSDSVTHLLVHRNDADRRHTGPEQLDQPGVAERVRQRSGR